MRRGVVPDGHWALYVDGMYQGGWEDCNISAHYRQIGPDIHLIDGYGKILDNKGDMSRLEIRLNKSYDLEKHPLPSWAELVEDKPKESLCSSCKRPRCEVKFNVNNLASCVAYVGKLPAEKPKFAPGMKVSIKKPESSSNTFAHWFKGMDKFDGQIVTLVDTYKHNGWWSVDKTDYALNEVWMTPVEDEQEKSCETCNAYWCGNHKLRGSEEYCIQGQRAHWEPKKS